MMDEKKESRFAQPMDGIHVVDDGKAYDWNAMEDRVKATTAQMAKKGETGYKGKPKKSGGDSDVRETAS